MRVTALFRRAPQARIAPASNIRELGRTGSWLAFTCATIAACALIFSAGAQNVAHAYSLGLASSEFRALVLAAASAGASILGPFAWLALIRGRGFGPRAAALLLALGCVAYAGVCSLGFVAGSRDTASAAVSERVDAYQDKRAVAVAARAELASLKGQTRAVIERRRELARILAPSANPTSGTPASVNSDSQAAAVAFYLNAAGFKTDAATVMPWLNLGMVLFLELAAALGLTAAALYPSTRRTAPEALPAVVSVPGAEVPTVLETGASEPAPRSQREKDGNGDDQGPPAAKPRSKGGRPATVLPAQAVERLRKAGGTATGSIRSVGKLLGVRSKTAAHRTLHRLQSLGLIRMDTGPQGVRVALA